MRATGAADAPHVVVVGGGLAGWMAGAALRRTLRRARWAVTVVAPPARPAPPAALATRPDFTRFLLDLGFDEPELMRRCGATYRLADRIADWIEPGAVHWHPFGATGARPDGHALFHRWLKHRLATGAPEPYSDFAVQAVAAARGLGPHPEIGSGSSILDAGSYGYHLDRAALVRLLREVALSEGVRAVAGRVRALRRTQDGDVEGLDLEGGGRIDGTLFLDCTGAAAALIGGLGAAWIAEDALPVGAEIGLALPPDPARPAFTAYDGARGGWVARIPLAARTLCAYAHPGSDPARAEADLRRLTGAAPEAAVFHRTLRIGHRPQAWTRNVVAVGAAARDAGALRGTDLHPIQRALELLVAHLPRGVGEPVLRRAYNARMGALFRDLCDGLAAHYRVSRRPEPFWTDRRRSAMPESLADRLDLYEAAGRIEAAPDAAFDDEAWYHLLASGDHLPRRPFAPIDLAGEPGLAPFLADLRVRVSRIAGTLAPHARALAAIHGALPPAAAGILVAPGAPPAPDEAPAAAHLLGVVKALGQPFGLERSVKAAAGTLQTGRFLLSLHRTGLGPDPGPALHALAGRLDLPEPERREAAAAIAAADILHLGYEADAAGPLYKLYVEWSSAADRAWAGADAPGAGPMLVHRAYKWRPGGGERPVVTLYHWPRVRAPAEIAARIGRLPLGPAGAPVLRLAEDTIALAGREGRGALHYLEAAEQGNPRLSYDLNLYATGLRVGAAEPLLLAAFRALGVREAEAAVILRERRGETLGHVAGGVGRDGRPFVTLYSGMRDG